MEMKARDLVLLTGGSPTKTFALLQDIGVQGDVTQRQLSYAVQKMNDNVGLDAADTQLFLAAMGEPATPLQEKSAAFYNSLQSYFWEVHRADVFAPEDSVVADAAPEPEDLTLPEDDDEDFDMFEAPETEVQEPSPVEPAPAGDDELPWADDGEEVDLDFLDEPSVGAEPVSYDRSSLEDENSPAEVVTDTTPEVESGDDLEDLFG